MEIIKNSLTNKDIEIFTKLFINNEFIESDSKTTIQVINPSNESILCSISEARETDVDKAVECALSSFKEWKLFPLNKKAKLFFKLADLLENNLEDFAYLESLDNGKVYNDSIEDVQEVVNCIRYYGGWVDKIEGSTYSAFDDFSIQTRRVPLGVVALISPWNYPLLMCAWKIFPALCSGNTIVLKPSEETPLTILKLGKLIIEAGFPKGVINIIPGYGNIAGSRLSNHPKVNKISFTGSTKVGRLILKASADSNLKNVHLELGGKSPIVICEDADIEEAIPYVIDVAFRNTSQNCVCGSRIIIHEKIYDEFVKKLITATKELKVGDAFTPENFIGPVINKRQLDSILDFIKYGIETEKLNLGCGGKRMNNDKGYFVEPTIFTDVSDDSKLAREEIFGPVLCILKPFKNIMEAIERANDSPYGLAAGIFTGDSTKAELFIRNIDAGSIWVNNANVCPYYVPFGGMKQSGFGRDNGYEAVLEYTSLKSVYYKNNISKFNK